MSSVYRTLIVLGLLLILAFPSMALDTATPTMTPTRTSTVVYTATPSRTPTVSPTSTSTAVPTTTCTPTSIPTATPSPTQTPTPVAGRWYQVTIPSDTAVTMGDAKETIPFTIRNVGNTGNIEKIDIAPNADWYWVSDTNWTLQIPGWTVDEIRNSGTGNTFIRFLATGSGLAPGESQVFPVTLHGPSPNAEKEAVFPKDASDQMDVLSGLIVKELPNTQFSLFGGALPQWPRVGLAAWVDAIPISGNVGTEFDVSMRVANRSTTQQTAIMPTPFILEGSGKGAIITTPTPTALNLASGASDQFLWKAVATQGPDLVFVGQAGNGNVSSEKSDSNRVIVWDLAGFMYVNPLTAISGDTVRVSFMVLNHTGQAITNVQPKNMTFMGSATATLLTGPVPATQGRLDDGEAITFEYEYKIEGNDRDTYQFSAVAVDDERHYTNVTTSDEGVIGSYMVELDPRYVANGSSNVALKFTVTNNSGTPVDWIKILSPVGFENYVSCAIPTPAPTSTSSPTPTSTPTPSATYDWPCNSQATPPDITFTAPAGNELPGDGSSAAFYLNYSSLPPGVPYAEFLFKVQIHSTTGVVDTREVIFAVTQYDLELEANPSTGLQANGSDVSTVTITVTKAGTPIPNAGVRLRTSAGTLSTSYVVTGPDGTAQVLLTAPQSDSALDVTVTAYFMNLESDVLIHFDAVALPPGGWTNIESDLPVAGLEIYGDQKSGGIAGLPITDKAYTESYLAHFHNSTRWWTGIAVANPSQTLVANVTLTAYDGSGTELKSVQIQVPDGGKISQLASALFGVEGTGWVRVQSDIPVVAMDIYGDTISGGLAALSATQPYTTLVIPHYNTSTRWWTGIAVANPNPVAQDITLTAYDDTGTLVNSILTNVVANGKVVGYVSDLLSITGSSTGWILVEASSAPVVGLVLFGDKQASPNQIAALPAMPIGAMNVYFPGFKSYATASPEGWWTGIAVANPSDTLVANVVVKAYDKTGVQLGTAVNQTLQPQQKIVKLVSSLFSVDGVEGWVEATSDQPIVGLELLGLTSGKKGLAGVEGPTETSTQLYLPHYASSARWWTLLAIANPSDLAQATVRIEAAADSGSYGGWAERTIPANGAVIEDFVSLFTH